jgi:hypothetical protein
MKDESFGFGTKPCMKEVPAGATAVFSFRGDPELVETEYGEKYSFPITLVTHPSYPLPDGNSRLMLDMDWQSKCQSAKQLYNGIVEKNQGTLPQSKEFYKKLKTHYEESAWNLTRFDTGAYWLEIVQ